MRYAQGKLLKGLAAGAVGGLVASWTMNKFQEAWSGAGEVLKNGNRKPHRSNGQEEDVTMKTAGKVCKAVLRRELAHEQKQKAGPFVHYAFGTAIGALYGAAAELKPGVKYAAGLPFGTAVFVGVDELALPVLKLTKPPHKYPVTSHVYGLSSHLAYGLTAELVRRNGSSRHLAATAGCDCR